MAFVKISEQPSLYNDLEKKSVREILEDINTEDQKVALAVQKAIPQIEKLVTQIVPRMKQGGRIFYMGAGTSGRLGVLDASEIPPTFGMPPTLVIGLIAGGDTALRNPVENAEDDMNKGWQELTERNVTDKDTVIGIAASGTTPYVIGALHEAREHGILTACITSVALFITPSLYEPATLLRLLVVLAAGLAGPVGLAAVFLLFLFSLSEVSALGVPYLTPHTFPRRPMAEDGVIRRDYRRMSRRTFNIWQRRD